MAPRDFWGDRATVRALVMGVLERSASNAPVKLDTIRAVLGAEPGEEYVSYNAIRRALQDLKKTGHAHLVPGKGSGWQLVRK
jgi:DNA-binding IscR family transcriptional regulator